MYGCEEIVQKENVGEIIFHYGKFGDRNVDQLAYPYGTVVILTKQVLIMIQFLGQGQSLGFKVVRYLQVPLNLQAEWC